MLKCDKNKEMRMRKIRSGRRRCIICVGEVNVIVNIYNSTNIGYQSILISYFASNLWKHTKWVLICIKTNWSDR